MSDFRRTIEPGGSEQLAAVGKTVYIKDASGPAELVFGGSDIYGVEPGDKVTPGQQFNEFRIENPGDYPVTLQLVVTRGDFDQRIVGAVSIRDSVPLRVNVAEQSLPDRPYLRAKQTFGASSIDDPSSVDSVYILNPSNSPVSIIDPIVTLIADGPFVADVFHFTHGRNDSYGVRGENLNFATGERSIGRFGGRNAEVLSDGLWQTVQRFDSLCAGTTDGKAVFAPRHGGVIIAPGHGVCLSTTGLPDGENFRHIWQWIEQPNEVER